MRKIRVNVGLLLLAAWIGAILVKAGSTAAVPDVFIGALIGALVALAWSNLKKTGK